MKDFFHLDCRFKEAVRCWPFNKKESIRQFKNWFLYGFICRKDCCR